MPGKLRINHVLDQCLVTPGRKVHLKRFDPAWSGGKRLKDLREDQLKERAKDFLAANTQALAEAQELLWASDTHSVLIVFQAMDAAGKDGTIKHVMSGVNPQGCEVCSFKQPSKQEIDHTFLWRYMKEVPERGQIVIFNRSHYEDVLVVKVHPELLEKAQLPRSTRRDNGFWKARYEDINNFERHLHRNGTLIIKFFLNVSKSEQKKRFLERLENPEKHWKFSMADMNERGYWKQYMNAYEDMMSATSTPWAPWHVIPANNKWVMRALVSAIITHRIHKLDIEYPQLSAEQRAALSAAKRQLMRE